MENKKTSLTLEERLQPWIDQGEYIIALTIIVMSWAGGWVDLLAFESWNPVIFGRYSVVFFGIFLVYSLGFVLWFWLIRSLSALDYLKRLIAFFQNNLLAFLVALIGIVAVLWSMMAIEWWATFPLIQANVLIIMALFVLLVLFTKPNADVSVHLWRKIAIGLLVAVLIIEGVLQGLAAVGMLPFNTLSGLTVPYGRVYQSQQGFASAQTNEFGWYDQDYQLQEDNYRIMVIGDQYVAGTQVALNDHFGQRLENQFVEAESEMPIEVIVQGQLGYGAEMYLSPLIYAPIYEVAEPDEFVVVLHLANDFLMTPLPEDYMPSVQLARGATPYINIPEFETWHAHAHDTIAGHDAPNLLRIIYSNSLLLNAIGIYGFDMSSPALPLKTDSATSEAPFGDASFLFETEPNDEANSIIEKLLQEIVLFNEFMGEQGIEVKIVTVPYFPSEFYHLYEGTDWDTIIDGYDMLLPDNAIAEVVEDNNIPYLSLGNWMQDSGLDVESIQNLFFNEGVGYFNEDGHQYLADAIFTYFYDSE